MGVVAFYFSSVRLCAGQVRCGYSKPHRLTARPQPEYPSTSGYFEFELYTYTYVIVYVYVYSESYRVTIWQLSSA